jgi:hypothetical protein
MYTVGLKAGLTWQMASEKKPAYLHRVPAFSSLCLCPQSSAFSAGELEPTKNTDIHWDEKKNLHQEKRAFSSHP